MQHYFSGTAHHDVIGAKISFQAAVTALHHRALPVAGRLVVGRPGDNLLSTGILINYRHMPQGEIRGFFLPR